MNIVVLGPGAIGALWACSLQSAGHNVGLWSRQSATSLELQLDQHPVQQFANCQSEQLQQCDLLLVTVKAGQVSGAMQSLKNLIADETIIVLMHNGMGTAENVATLLPRNPLLLATTSHGAYRVDANHVRHTGNGTTQIGPYNQLATQCAFVSEVMQHALPPVSWQPDIQQALWQKLAINCAINPLTALHQISNGQLLEPRFTSTLEQLVTEVAQVMRAEGIEVTAEDLLQRVYQVAEATAANYSSMQQDIFYRRQSEIDFITGHLLNIAQKHGLTLPQNQALYSAIKQIEQGWNKQ
ncbi:2-dehydropantoate 2-reductase [Vibrio sp.]|uniref:2-dehydropantoate 2-reductase n=1 Tax=Vibrio sp. TaxID=678 RepID=UPI003D13C143